MSAHRLPDTELDELMQTNPARYKHLMQMRQYRQDNYDSILAYDKLKRHANAEYYRQYNRLKKRESRQKLKEEVKCTNLNV